jgi:hypothetical protein
MKFSFILTVFCACALWAQTVPPKETALEDETVLATFDDGYKLTYGELKAMAAALPPQMQQTAMRDRKAFVRQFALMRKLSRLAEQNKLDQKCPTRELLLINRMYVLMSAQINFAVDTAVVPPEELQKYYDANKDRYAQVKVKVIYVGFCSNPAASAPGKKYLTEAEAKARIEKIRAEIVAGADFVKMVKQHSEDQASAEKDGDFGNIRRNDNVPEPIRNAVFALKAGEVSQPVRQPNGFYLFRAEEVGTRAFQQVRDEIFNEVKQLHFKQWMDQTEKGLNVKYVNETFFNQPAPAAPAPAPPAQPAPAPPAAK